MKLFAATLLTAAVAACGGTSSPSTTTTTTEGHDHDGHAGDDGHHDHPPMPPEMNAFHDVLAPLWHAEPGPQRMADTCAAVDELRRLGHDMSTHPPATADETAWIAEGGALDNNLNELEASCANDGQAAEGVLPFDAAFERVHETFHAIMALVPKA